MIYCIILILISLCLCFTFSSKVLDILKVKPKQCQKLGTQESHSLIWFKKMCFRFVTLQLCVFSPNFEITGKGNKCSQAFILHPVNHNSYQNMKTWKENNVKLLRNT